MKTSFLFVIIMQCIIINTFGQAPQFFNYQAIIRDNSGTAIQNQLVSIQINMLQGSATGSLVYSETHNVTTNTFGIVILEIGNGNNQTGSFAGINWANGPYFISIDLDISGGTNYTAMGTTQLVSVPYALFAGNANSYLAGSGLTLNGTTFNSTWTATGNSIFNNNTDFVGIGTANPTTALHVNGTLRITDDSEGFGKIFTSDASGNGAWKFPAISLSNGNANFIPKFISPNSLDNSLIYQNGNKLGIGTTTPTSRLVIIADTTAPDTEALFEVKDKAGKTVFVVYNDSVHIFVNDFASPGKTENRGSFAVSGKSSSKGLTHPFFAVNFDSSEIVNPSQNRVLWYPARNAFLTGRVLVENKDSVGINSFASGYESKAMGRWSQALGYQATARGDYATAIGKNAIANANTSFAFGVNPKALGLSSYAFGAGAIANNNGSYAIGSQGRDTLGNPVGGFTIADGDYSMALGQGSHTSNIGAMTFGINNVASGKNSQAFGFTTTASHTYALAFGNSTTASGLNSTSMGCFTNASGQYSTAMGRNTTASGTYTTAMGFGASAIGNNSFAIGYYVTANGINAIAMGDQTSADGISSFAMGQQSDATGNYSTALGYHNIASGGNSTAIGTSSTAFGYSSFAAGNATYAAGLAATTFGYQTSSNANYSFAAGNNTKAKSFNVFVIGRYNDTTSISSTLWNTADPLFIIGNGGSNASRSNAMTVLKSGETFLPTVYTTTVGATNRDLYIDNTGKLGYLSSSARYKTNVSDMENISWIYKLRPVNYQYKTDLTKHKEYGLIAEEVEKINSLFVSYNPDGTAETVNYSKLITPLLKSIQDQKKEIDELKNKNEILQNKIEELSKLKAEIDTIKSIINSTAKK